MELDPKYKIIAMVAGALFALVALDTFTHWLVY